MIIKVNEMITELNGEFHTVYLNNVDVTNEVDTIELVEPKHNTAISSEIFDKRGNEYAGLCSPEPAYWLIEWCNGDVTVHERHEVNYQIEVLYHE